MRLRELRIAAFGTLQDAHLDEESLSDGVNVVCGPNEAGKTTLRNVCKALFYGFHPVRDYPYRPWDTNLAPEVTATLALDTGEPIEVFRKLTGRAQGSLRESGELRDLSNQDLPYVQHVKRNLYDALYSLTLTDMAELKGGDREEVEDRLLGVAGVELLRPVSQVAAELQGEAGRLWKPNRRGKQQCRELQARLREVHRERKEALARDEATRDSARQLAEIRRRLGEIDEELPRLKAYVHQAEVLLPLKRRLEQLADWRAEIPDMAAAERLPGSPVEELQRARVDVEEHWRRLIALLGDRRRLEARRGELTPADEELLSRANDIRAWMRESSRLQDDSHDIARLEGELRRGEQALADAAEDVLDQPWSDELGPALLEIAPAELKGRIDRYEERAREHQRLADQKVDAVIVAEPLPLWAVLLAAGVGATLLVGGWLGSRGDLSTAIGLVAMLGLFLLVAAASLGAVHWHQRRQRASVETRRSEESERLASERAEAAERADQAREAVQEALAGLPVAAALRERPDLDLVRLVDSLRPTMRECDSTRTELAERREKLAEERRELDSLLAELGCSPGLAGLDEAEERLREAGERRQSAADASQRLEEIGEALQRDYLPQLRRAREVRHDLAGRIRAAVPHAEPLEAAAERAVEVRRLADRVRAREEELEAEHPNLEDLRAQLHALEAEGDDAGRMDQESVESAKLRIDTLLEEKQEGSVAAASLEHEIDSARGDESVAELDGEIARLEEELHEAQRRRDRLVLLESILRRADEDFRREHQPDVIQRAGRYVREITQGRYGALQMMTNDKGEDHLAAVVGDGFEWHYVQAPLSGGTLDQIYLAFRLAVVDHLDEGHERLPLFLDEVFVNWDRDRGERAAQLLAGIGRTRQVFVLTCHPEWAERLVRATDGGLIELGAS